MEYLNNMNSVQALGAGHQAFHFSGDQKTSTFGGDAPAFKHYRREKTNKAPRKRTFIANMTKQPQQLTETLASSARGVGSGLGTAMPTEAMAASVMNASARTSALAFAQAAPAQPAFGARATSLNALPGSVPQQQHLVQQQPPAAAPISHATPVMRPVQSAAPPAAAQPPLMFCHGRPVAPTATYSDPELMAALAKLEAGAAAANNTSASPAFYLGYPTGAAPAPAARAITTTVDKTPQFASRMVLTSGGASAELPTTEPFTSAAPPAKVRRVSSSTTSSSRVSAAAGPAGSAGALLYPATQHPADSTLQYQYQQYMTGAAGSPSGSAASDDTGATLQRLDSLSETLSGVTATTPSSALSASRVNSVSSSAGSFTGLLMADEAAVAAPPQAASWEPLADLDAGEHGEFLDFLFGLDDSAAPMAAPAPQQAAAPSLKRGFKQMQGQQQGQRQQQRSELASQVDALLGGLVAPDQPAALPAAGAAKHAAVGAEEDELPAAWLDELLGDSSGNEEGFQLDALFF